MVPTWAIILDYIMGMIMWTLIGRAFMNIFQREDSTFFFMRVFVKYTNPVINLFKFITPSFLWGPFIALYVAWFFYLLWVYPKFSVPIFGGVNDPILGIDHLRFGMIGAPICLVVMVVVSLMTKEPDAATQKMVDDTRIPTGKAILGKQH